METRLRPPAVFDVDYIVLGYSDGVYSLKFPREEGFESYDFDFDDADEVEWLNNLLLRNFLDDHEALNTLFATAYSFREAMATVQDEEVFVQALNE